MEHSLLSTRLARGLSATSLATTPASGEPQPGVMRQVEDGDLDMRLSMALVLTGKYRDLMEMRRLVREKVAKSEGARLIRGQLSSVPLYIVKEPQWRRLKDLETQSGGDKKIG